MVLSLACRLFVPLLLCACSTSLPLQDDFYPSLRARDRSPDEWVRMLERGGEDPVRALWCIYYSGYPSVVTRRAVRRRFQSGTPEERRVFEAILQLWGDSFRPLTMAEYGFAKGANPRPGKVAEGIAGTFPERLFKAPVRFASGTNDELWRMLMGGDVEESRRAAASLIVRRADVDRVLRTEFSWNPLSRAWFDPAPDSYEAWVLDQVGDAAGRAVGYLLEHTHQEAQVEDLLRLAARHPASMRSSMGAIAAWMDHGRLGRRAVQVLRELTIGPGALGHELLHSSLDAALFDDQRQERRVATGLARALSGHPDDWTTELLDLVEYLGVHSQAVRESCEPRLLDALERSNRRQDRALRILCHHVSGSKNVRSMFLDSLNRRTDFSSGSLWDLPCWKNHDRGTLSAFLPVLRRVKDKHDIVYQLDFGGIRDAREYPLLSDLFDDMAESGLRLRRAGFLGYPPIRAGDTLDLRVHKLAITIATRRADGRAAEQEVRWLSEILNGYRERAPSGGTDHLAAGLQHAKELGLLGAGFQDAAFEVLRRRGSGTVEQVEAAHRLLDSAQLSPRSQAILDHLREGRRSGRPKRFSEAVQYIPWLRLQIYAGNVERIADLLPLCGLFPRDEGYLLAALDRGGARTRGKALELVRDFEIRSSNIRSAVRKLKNDPHEPNQLLVQELTRE